MNNISNFHAFCVGAPRSGEGKTTISIALMRLFSRMGQNVQGFKCGPDYIDPTFHRMVTGYESANLDTWMMGEKEVQRIFAEKSVTAQVSICEGVMGIFDGKTRRSSYATFSAESHTEFHAKLKNYYESSQNITLPSISGSTVDVARVLEIPIILVLDAKAMASSVAAMVSGYTEQSKKYGVQIAGVIANNVGSINHANILRNALLEWGLPPLLGYLPRNDIWRVDERQLGLLPCNETQKDMAWADSLADALAETLDIDLLLKVTQKQRITPDSYSKKTKQLDLHLGIAKDEAFCFYYEANIKFLEKRGWKIVYFSPLRDKELPKNIDALYLGGGYPEVFAKELSHNASMRENIKEFAESGARIFAECGGFMYLTKELCVPQTHSHEKDIIYPMCNVFNARAIMGNKLRSLGYREIFLLKNTIFSHAIPIWKALPPKPSSKGAEPLCKPHDLRFFANQVCRKSPMRGLGENHFPQKGQKNVNWNDVIFSGGQFLKIPDATKEYETYFRGHEFHWSDIEFHEIYAPFINVNNTPCGAVYKNVCASYVHFYFAQCEYDEYTQNAPLQEISILNSPTQKEHLQNASMLNSPMKNTHAHGGDLLVLSEMGNCKPLDIIDFSVNVRPEGMPEFLRSAVLKSIKNTGNYPSPHGEEAKRAIAKYYNLPKERFVFGNGSNELLHAVLGVLHKNGMTTACIFEPSFSEYALACQKVGINIHRIFCDLIEYNENQEPVDYAAWNTYVETIPLNSLVFFANPANPSGMYIPPTLCEKWVKKRSDCLWFFDEAFMDYVPTIERGEGEVDSTVDGEVNHLESMLFSSHTNVIVLRSLTKFYAMASLRLGYIYCPENIAILLQNSLPAWNVNGIALDVACALWNQNNMEIVRKDAQETRQKNIERRQHLYTLLKKVKGIKLFASTSNYILFSLPEILSDMPSETETDSGTWKTLLQKHTIALRDCSNYYGLGSNYFRAAVRFPEDHEKLADALEDICGANVFTEKKEITRKTPALMLLGTSSNAGKSILTSAFCRIFQQDGYSVKPFKAQNMSLNSGVTALGDEMGRAQIVQAQACRVDPDARMNPILLKPHTDMGSQVIVLGKSIGHMNVREYYAKKADLWKDVTNAYDELANSCDIMVLEGAGSPAEINLKAMDIVNMQMAQYANASALLVGDIDRGGVYASFLGTWMTFSQAEEKVLSGYLVNRFRGDATLLDSAHTYMLEHTAKPVLGVVPYIKDLKIPEEDMAGSIWAQVDKKNDNSAIEMTFTGKDRKLDIAIIMLAHISNHTDFEALAIEPQCNLRSIRCVEDFGNPDVVIIPGSKNVVTDLNLLHECGLVQKIMEHAQNKWLVGICGGLQMMGVDIYDPLAVESVIGHVHGLGLLQITSEFAKEKTLTTIENVQGPYNTTLQGYEIHHGISRLLTPKELINKNLTLNAMNKISPTINSNSTTRGENSSSTITNENSANINGNSTSTSENFWHLGRACGYTSHKKIASYIHGLFDEKSFRHGFLNHVRIDLGLNSMITLGEYDIERELDRLANIVRQSVDMKAIYASMGIER